MMIAEVPPPESPVDKSEMLKFNDTSRHKPVKVNVSHSSPLQNTLKLKLNSDK